METKHQDKEAWQILCEKAAQEQDPERLLALVKEINRLLDQRWQPREQDKAA